MHTSKRSQILERIHSAYAAGESTVEELNALLAEHDAISCEEEQTHDSVIAHQLQELSQWERLQRTEHRSASLTRAIIGEASAPMIIGLVDPADDDYIAIDDSDFLPEEGCELSSEEQEALEWADFSDDTPTLTYTRNTEAPPKCEDIS
jgi:hypothetical protein